MRQPSNQEPNSQNNGGILTPVEIVAKAILSVNKVATDILSVITVANNEETVKDVSLNMNSIVAVADIKQAITMLSSNLSNIDLVANHLGQVGNVSNNMATLLLLHGKMNQILRLESHLDGLNEIILNMDKLEEVREAIPDIATLISHMLDIVKVAESIEAITGVFTNLDSLLTLSLNIDAVKILNENIDIIIASATYVEQIEENLQKIELIEQNVIALEASTTASKDIAVTKAEEALNSANAAATNNAQSLQNKNAAELAADASLTYRNQAGSHAQIATTKATEASSSASNAALSRQAAKVSEDNAKASENTSTQNSAKTGEDRAVVEGLAETVNTLSQQVANNASQVQTNKNSVDQSVTTVQGLTQTASNAATTASQQATIATQEADRAKTEADKAASLLDTKVDKDSIGTVASRDVMTSPTDMVTPNAIMPRGAFGWGGEVTYRSFELTTSFGNLFGNNLELTVPVMVLLFRVQPNRKLAGRVTCGRAVGSFYTSQYVIDLTCATNSQGSITSCTVNVSGGSTLRFSPHIVTYGGEAWLALDTGVTNDFMYPAAYIFDGYAINEELRVVPRQDCTDITPYQAGGVFRTNGHTVYHTGNAVAPVSAGGLVEFGVTPNGRFWRYAGGMQITQAQVSIDFTNYLSLLGGGVFSLTIPAVAPFQSSQNPSGFISMVHAAYSAVANRFLANTHLNVDPSNGSATLYRIDNSDMSNADVSRSFLVTLIGKHNI